MKMLLSRLTLALLLIGSLRVPLQAQVIGAETDGGEILTRGPIHEAFAGVVSFRPEAGLIVDRAPPEAIEELPPEERPVEGDTAWIPGYWGWDDERNDFIWISGTWRVLPPGRAWIAGYWRDTGRGWQWVSGYWEDASRREVVYLAPPPESLERGPSSPAPSPDFEWAPGYWEWRDDRYLWRPGYWIEGRTEWVWVPSCYVWTPRGYVFVEGYWDYAPEERGLLFAPVYYREHRRSRYEYRPSIVLNVAILADYLFLRPRYSHYYFGDYYDARYESSGFYAAFSYQTSRGGYDPFYSYSRWRHRDDREWDRQYRASYDYRRRNVDARPPRTWSGSTLTVNVNVNQNFNQSGEGARRQSVTYAQPIQQYARSRDAGIRVESNPQVNSQQQVQVARQIQEQRTQRRTMESQGGSGSPGPQSGPASRQIAPDRQAGASGQGNTVASQAVGRVALPTSPIVAREGAGGRQPPPRAQGSRREDSPRTGRAENPVQPDARGQRDPGQSQPPIGSTPAPEQRAETVRPRERGGLRADNSAAAESQRRQEQAQRDEQRQAEDAARRNARPDQEQIRSQQPPAQQPVIGQPGQGRDRGDERRALENQERTAQQPPQPQAERVRDDQQRREQERRDQQRLDQQQTRQQQADQRYQQAEAQQQARERQGREAEQAQAREQQARAAEQEKAQQARAAEQAQAREQQSRAADQAREREARAAEQARNQQQQAQAAEQERNQQAQAAERARDQQAQAAEQERAQRAREQQARAAEQAEAAKQPAAPDRRQEQPPPKKSKEQLEEEERKKGKG